MNQDIIHNLGRPYVLYASANGAVIISERGEKQWPTGYLPFFSTDTHEQASSLQVRFCKLARNGSGIYFLNEFKEGDLDELHRWSGVFAESYKILA